jgi:hypothetical protein
LSLLSSISLDPRHRKKRAPIGGSEIFSITIYLCLLFFLKKIKQRDKRASASLQKRKKEREREKKQTTIS